MPFAGGSNVGAGAGTLVGTAQDTPSTLNARLTAAPAPAVGATRQHKRRGRTADARNVTCSAHFFPICAPPRLGPGLAIAVGAERARSGRERAETSRSPMRPAFRICRHLRRRALRKATRCSGSSPWARGNENCTSYGKGLPESHGLAVLPKPRRVRRRGGRAKRRRRFGKPELGIRKQATATNRATDSIRCAKNA